MLKRQGLNPVRIYFPEPLSVPFNLLYEKADKTPAFFKFAYPAYH